MAVARPADLRAARGVVVALPAPEAGTTSAETRSRVREKFATRPAGPLRKRPPPSAGPSSSRQPSRKKTRDVQSISFSACHGCRIDTGSSNALDVFESKWRTLLLCSGCLRAVQARDACAYCFMKFHGEDPPRRAIDCVECRCRVHLVCIPGQRGFVTPYDLDPGVFSCVDCCAIPLYFRPPMEMCSKPKCSPAVIKTMVNDLVRDADAFMKRKTVVAELATMDKAEATKLDADQARNEIDFAPMDSKVAVAAELAKQKAMDKVEATKLAADQARNAFDFAPMDSKVADEELALRLHLKMNGSQRISRSQPSVNHQNSSSNSKRAVPNGCLNGQNLGPDKSNLHEVKVQPDDISIVNIHVLGSLPLGIKLDAEQPSSLTNGSCRIRDEIVRKYKIMDPVTEEPTGSQCKVLNPAVHDCGIDSEYFSASSTGSDENYDGQVLVENCVEVLANESSTVHVQLTSITPDRYLKKYSRNSRLRRNPIIKDVAQPVPVLGPCSSCSNASRDFVSASFDASVFSVDASANVSGSSG